MAKFWLFLRCTFPVLCVMGAVFVYDMGENYWPALGELAADDLLFHCLVVFIFAVFVSVVMLAESLGAGFVRFASAFLVLIGVVGIGVVYALGSWLELIWSGVVAMGCGGITIALVGYIIARNIGELTPREQVTSSKPGASTIPVLDLSGSEGHRRRPGFDG